MADQAVSLSTGLPYPLGATLDERGVNFALYAGAASGVTLCLFDTSGAQERARYTLTQCENGVWFGRIDDVKAGAVYGYRVSGEWAPERGLRHNPELLLLDPYAREVVGEFGKTPLLARVTAETYDWGDDAPPCTPWGETVIYEAHVRGLTMRHPEIPAELRGSYAALAHPAIIAHLQMLGVTAIELLPVQYFLDEPRLIDLGLKNYWGYNPLAWFAPASRYWSGRAGTTPLSEFRDAVKALHAAGIEVILDVVFNHTAELDAPGPVLGYRGIDNAAYYVLNGHGEYENWTGCGNVLNLSHPRVVQLVMDALRYWVGECHVDGFRFDLAPILGRVNGGFSALAPLLVAMQQDPLLTRVKLIAEPWDIGPGGYQLGQFPAGWGEWNDQYRDAMRQFWLHDGVNRALFARRFAASSDRFQHAGRAPQASVNFLTAHDGFTLRDIVSYNHKHNLANKEHNRDGHSHNLSWNCGAEGPSDDAGINTLRERAQKALLATLLLSQGTPMLLAGDELGHSQQGNNNAYCQDNDITWLDWQNAQSGLADYVAELIAIRKSCPALTAAHWWRGAEAGATADVQWLNPSGDALHPHDWDDAAGRALMILLAGDLLILLNASAHQLHFHLPAGSWQLRLASTGDAQTSHKLHDCRVAARSVTVLTRFDGQE
ncbi:glycogen debranching protein GlgX [Chitinilyticum piscinae]|uniref:Glycogen debranching protein GlgX n=1 Tax=Chitinilyticum piscinae TaxID=2866724 RepID=A0A8J7FTG1_9NEIS|nr:glycogen debranching protein GlgX [Chitinilyticum piscinae]MBE9610236.1 glycogen debranching protein GlgX [Chitinilyticum piscinae]